MNYIGKAIDEFERWFDILNEKYFEKSLVAPVFTIQKARSNNYGHFTLNPIWQGKSEDVEPFYEINIAAHQLHREAADICGTVLHEMIHYWHKVNEIKDCSGNIHNKKFKAKSEALGFVVEKSKQCGWGHTTIDGALKEFIVDVVKPNDDVFTYARMQKIELKAEPKKTTFKFVCPECETVAKAKPDALLTCGNCDVKMEMEDQNILGRGA